MHPWKVDPLRVNLVGPDKVHAPTCGNVRAQKECDCASHCILLTAPSLDHSESLVTAITITATADPINIHNQSDLRLTTSCRSALLLKPTSSSAKHAFTADVRLTGLPSSPQHLPSLAVCSVGPPYLISVYSHSFIFHSSNSLRICSAACICF